MARQARSSRWKSRKSAARRNGTISTICSTGFIAAIPAWIAPLLLERKLHFTPKHNPFFAHAEAEFFLAYKDGQPVGRMTAQIDQLHLARYHDATGHFGFLEAVDDAEVFSALIKKAEDWLSLRGMERALGPVSFSMWDQAGLLVEGFDTPPYVLMGHHLPYYAGHIEAAGYHPAQDLLAYRYGPGFPYPKRWAGFWIARSSAVMSPCAPSAKKKKTFPARFHFCWTSSTTPGRTIGVLCRNDQGGD